MGRRAFLVLHVYSEKQRSFKFSQWLCCDLFRFSSPSLLCPVFLGHSSFKIVLFIRYEFCVWRGMQVYRSLLIKRPLCIFTVFLLLCTDTQTYKQSNGFQLSNGSSVSVLEIMFMFFSRCTLKHFT